MEAGKARLKSLEEYAIECAILKVHGSKCRYTVDEGLQIMVGRASPQKVQWIALIVMPYQSNFEGTNEIKPTTYC